MTTNGRKLPFENVVNPRAMTEKGESVTMR